MINLWSKRPTCDTFVRLVQTLQSAGLLLLCCCFFLCPQRFAFAVTMQQVISRCAAIAAAVDPHRPDSEWSHLKTAHFACTSRTAKQQRCDHSSQGYTVQKSIPALLMQHRERNCRAESLQSAWSELTMALATGLLHDWSRCAVQMCRSAPRPRVSVVQHQHQLHRLKQQQRSSPLLPLWFSPIDDLSHCERVHWCLWLPQSSDDSAHLAMNWMGSRSEFGKSKKKNTQ